MSDVQGIYKISFDGDKRVYVGQSGHIGRRWLTHLLCLGDNTHVNPRLQECFNTLGATAIHFSILEVVPDADLLNDRERFWLNYYTPHLFNIQRHIRSAKTVGPDFQRFIDTVNRQWLVPAGADTKSYRLWRNEDKQALVQLAMDCNICHKPLAKITFISVIKLMEEQFGYEIEQGRSMIEGRQHTYRLIVAFNEDEKCYVPAFKTISE